jgi:predicted O-methyltransferase YrrM
LETYRPNSNAKVVAFDTFDAAFPDLRENESKGEKMLSAHFDPKALEKLEQAIARNGLQKRVEIVRGDISATLPKYLADNPGFRISLLHCDLDAYAPTRATLETAWPRVVSGGLAVFDNYGIPHWGEADAVDEFFQTLASKPAISTLSSSPTPAAYCIKP